MKDPEEYKRCASWGWMLKKGSSELTKRNTNYNQTFPKSLRKFRKHLNRKCPYEVMENTVMKLRYQGDHPLRDDC